MSNIKFIKINKDDTYVEELFNLLTLRGIHSISHRNDVSFDDHCAFVLNHPYRKWYLIKSSNKIIGSTYITYSNCLGVFLIKPNIKIFNQTIYWIKDNHSPLPEKKSCRPGSFYLNVAPSNKKLISILEECGAKKIQLSYIV